MTTTNCRETALVTGASSGIGRDIAIKLATMDYDLILTGRNVKELESTAEEIRRQSEPENPPVIIPADLSSEPGVKELITQIESRGLVVDVLVNNAGAGVHGNFIHTSAEVEKALNYLLISAPHLLTKTYLPGMVERGTGGFLNISSVYALNCSPWQAIYGAAKSWMVSFSLALREELRGTGVHATVVCAGTTSTEFRHRMGLSVKSSAFNLTSHQVAAEACQAFRKNQAVSIPGLYYKMFAQTSRLLPLSTLGLFVYLTAYRLRKVPVKRLVPIQKLYHRVKKTVTPP